MNTLEKLEKIYIQALDSESSEDFYFSVINYLSLVNDDNDLKDWLEDEYKKYQKIHEDIWSLERSNEEKSKRTEALERVSIGAWYQILNVVVNNLYADFEKAKADPETDLREDYIIDDSVWRKLKKKEKKYRLLFKKLHQNISIRAQNKKLFSFQPITGSFSYKEVTGRLNPNTREYNAFNKLYQNSPDLVTYEELIKAINPEKEDTQTARNELGQVISSIKQKFGILPESKTSNKDIFENVRNNGYKLHIPDE